MNLRYYDKTIFKSSIYKLVEVQGTEYNFHHRIGSRTTVF